MGHDSWWPSHCATAAGLIASLRGAHGGYSLARLPEDITVKDVVEAIEGRIAPVPCVDPEAEAGAGECGENPAGCDRVTTCAGSIWPAGRPTRAFCATSV